MRFNDWSRTGVLFCVATSIPCPNVEGFSLSPSFDSALTRSADFAAQCPTVCRAWHKDSRSDGGDIQRHLHSCGVEADNLPSSSIRRAILSKGATVTLASSGALSLGFLAASPGAASAEVGSLPEFADTNAILQGITVNVADASQQSSMIKFLEDGFDMKILRRRIRDSVEDIWLGYGPEQLSVPKEFELPVSSFAAYGGHASIRVRYDSTLAAPLYRQGDVAPGDNIAYLQLGVPGYRISQMVAAGGNILDAYGLVNVVSPCGLPIRGIVGISPDPIMFVAINCKDPKESKTFYESLGFVEREVPYSRPSNGATIFEPAPPKGSYYMAPSPNCMGVLLLPSKKKRAVTPNPCVESINIVYNPSSTSEETSTGVGEMRFKDPSLVAVSFQSAADFTAEEKNTR